MYIDFYTQPAGTEDLLWRGTCERPNMGSLNITIASQAVTEEEFIKAMMDEFEHDPKHYVPLHGWPHPYPTSADTYTTLVFSADRQEVLWYNNTYKDWYHDPSGSRLEATSFKFKWPEFAPNLEPYT